MDLARYRYMRSERLRLAPMDEADPKALVGALNDFEISRWLTRVPHPYTLADADEVMRDRKAEPAPVWLIHDDQGLAGGVALDKHLGYWLVPRVWGQGYATEAARLVLHAHFSDPEAADVGSSFFIGNDASAWVLAKLGFVETEPARIQSRALGHEVDAMEMVLTRDAHAKQPMFTLRTERLVLDGVTEADLPIIHAEWGDPRVARMTATVKPNWTMQEARDWLRARKGFGCAIRLPDSTLIGSVGMGGDPPNIGYMLGPNHWGKGYATEAVHAFLTAAYARLEDLDIINAGVFDDNPGSQRVLRKTGFERLGAGDCSSLARLEPAANSEYRLTRSAFEAKT